jgi:hypothetical protein
MYSLILFLSSSLFTADAFSFLKATRSRISPQTVLKVTTSPAPTENDIWWKEGLKFGCTSCGRCCQNEGEVWLDSDEFSDLSTHLKETPEATLEKYSEKSMSGWVKLKSQVSDDPKVNDRCIFLGDDGKQCGIYEARPIQCRTYPFWPRLLSEPAEWEKEAVQPDSVDVQGSDERHWSVEKGGCEGFTNPAAQIIDTRTVHRNHELYQMYTDVFPFLSTGDDHNRLIAKTSVIQGVTKATTGWVSDFVLKYNLCPFAEHVFVTGGIRYRVFLGTDKKKIMERVRYEVLALLTAKEEDVATTLLMLPFAFQNFEEFYDFSLDLEDDILPQIERDSQGPGQVIPPKRKSLLQKKMASKSSAAGDSTSVSGGMGSMSFGGNSRSGNSESSIDSTVSMGGPVRSQTGCPVIPSAQIPVDSLIDSNIHDTNTDRIHTIDDTDKEPKKANTQSQPFRETKSDDLPEIQVCTRCDMIYDIYVYICINVFRKIRYLCIMLIYILMYIYTYLHMYVYIYIYIYEYA